MRFKILLLLYRRKHVSNLFNFFMKNTFLIFIFILAMAFSAKSQDTIVQMDGQKIAAKVLEITPDYVKYKKSNNLDGPLVSIQKSHVHMIIYENGTQDVLNQKPTTVENTTEENNTEVQYNKIDKNNKGNVTTVTYSKIEYNKKVEDNKIFNLVKLNPLLIFVGDIPIYYERRISDHVGVEAGIGMTLTDYYFSSISDELIDNTTNTKMGYSFAAGLHLYTSKHYKGMEELYFSPEIRIRKYMTELYQYSGIDISPAIEQNRIITDFQIKLGFISYWSDNVSAEYYCGIGIRNRNINKALVTSTGNALIIEMQHTQDVVPCISAGVKIGFGW
jgi:hypothetical protein